MFIKKFRYCKHMLKKKRNNHFLFLPSQAQRKPLVTNVFETVPSVYN